MDNDLYTLRDRFMALDEGERENLRALLDHEEQRAEVRTSVEEDAFWKALQLAVPNGTRRFRNLSEFLRDKRHGVLRADYQDAVRTAFDMMADAKAVRHLAQDQAALLELFFECLGMDLRQRGVEVTPKQLVNSMSRLRLAVEDCYPGYVGAGMLHRLIRVVA